jgi:acetamidase/formamidase
MTEHLLDSTVTHSFWDNSFPPRLEIDPGDTVTFECREPLDGQVTPDSGAEVWANLDFSRVHSLIGPVYVRGARPGDALQVNVLAFEHHGWGWTGWFPGAGGLLADEFAYPHLQHWDIDKDGCRFRDGDDVDDLVVVPAEPFCGGMGVAPAEPGRFDTLPPRANGGNVDIRHLKTGATALLPVLVDGAGFATGDGHVAQGDGEVCCTAIEAPLTVTMRFDVRRDVSVPELQIVTPSPLAPAPTREYHATTGHGPDIYECARTAVRHMVDWLQSTHGMSRDRAYCLCSVAGDLRISQAVMQNKVVTFFMPLDVLTT